MSLQSHGLRAITGTCSYVPNGSGRDWFFVGDEGYRKGHEAIKSGASPIREITKNPRGPPLEVRQHRKLHPSGKSAASKTKAELAERWQAKVEENKKVILPKCKSLPKYYQCTYQSHGQIPGFSMPPAETPDSLLGDCKADRAREGQYGLVGYEEPSMQATYEDYGQTPGFKQQTRGHPAKHHSMSMPAFPDVQDVANWRPGVGPPINPDPAHEAKFFATAYMDHGQGFVNRNKGRPSKLHHHSIVGQWCGDADKSHGAKHKWDVLSCLPPGKGAPVNPDPANEARHFASTYADLGHWYPGDASGRAAAKVQEQESPKHQKKHDDKRLKRKQ